MDELNPTNAFGELLLDLIEAQYGGDYDAGVAAIVQTTGLGEEEVVAIISGDTIVEDESLLSSIIDAFPDADDDDLEVIVNVATGVDEADRQDLIGQIESDESMGGMQDDEGMEGMGGMQEEDPALQEAAYAYSRANMANFGVTNQLAARVNQLENHIVNFEYTNALDNQLSELDNLANNYVSVGALPPAYKSMLIGNFSSNDDRMVRFSQIAAQNGVDVPTMLFATQYAMGMLTDAANFVEFRDYSVTDEDVAVANFSASLDNQVLADIDAIFNN